MRGPSLDWLNANLGYVNTTSARAKIRSWFNRQERAINIQRGKDIYQKQVRRLIVGTTDEEAVKLMKLDNLDDFFAELGNGGITPAQVVAKLSENTEQMEKLPRMEVQPSGPSSGVQVLGVGDLLTRMARCCSPILGDKITGYITRSRGVTVHRAACPNVTSETEIERLVPVDWGRKQTLYPVRIRLQAFDRVGLLRDTTSLVSEERVNIAACVSEEFEDISIISLTVYVESIDQLSRLFAKLEGVRGVISVTRTAQS
jgi:GTP pyrophosphokinase